MALVKFYKTKKTKWSWLQIKKQSQISCE